MLIALMTILFLGGAGSSAVLAFVSQSSDAVEAVVEDENRRDAALETLDAVRDLGKQQIKARQNAQKQMEKVLAEHEESPDIVDDIWSGYYQQVRQLNDAALDRRFELRDQLTNDEWQRVFPQPTSDK